MAAKARADTLLRRRAQGNYRLAGSRTGGLAAAVVSAELRHGATSRLARRRLAGAAA